MLKGLGAFLFLLLVLVSVVESARVHGEVYSVYLDELSGAIVTVNSEPPQTKVAKDAQYSFELGPGTYTIKALYGNGEVLSAEEVIVISDSEGEYVIDVILLPENFEEELGNLEEDFGGNNAAVWVLLGVLMVVIGVIVTLKVRKKKGVEEEVKSEGEESLDELTSIVKKEGGRMTQKDLRKRMAGLSEAKVSLMITELEAKGVVKKIKKGRGNVIVLNKEWEKKKS